MSVTSYNVVSSIFMIYVKSTKEEQLLFLHVPISGPYLASGGQLLFYVFQYFSPKTNPKTVPKNGHAKMRMASDS